jgi:Iron-containing redox enzyme
MNANIEASCSEYKTNSIPNSDSSNRSLRTRAAKADAGRFGERLQGKVQCLLQRVLASPEWKSVEAPSADARYVSAVLKHVLLEVFSYGPHVTEATFTAIGRFPKDRPDLMKPMILHDIEEADHGEMALRDFVRLGGDEAWARARRITPESFAMAATVRLIAQSENPFAYLGYMYPFEALTPVFTERMQQVMARLRFPGDARHFIDFHAKEDIAHAKALRAFVERVVGDYPDAAEAIEYAFDCFAAVYPLPIWRAAINHALIEINHS